MKARYKVPEQVTQGIISDALTTRLLHNLLHLGIGKVDKSLARPSGVDELGSNDIILLNL